MKFFILGLSFLFFFGCSSRDETSTITNSTNNPPNILFIIADDLGKDAISGFSEGTLKPHTPNIDDIRNFGLSFTKFWSYPTCSPTRASILTGKYGYRTGVKWAGDEISLSETSLQKYINDETNNMYSTAIIGKWHLFGNNSNLNPEMLGIDYYAGLIGGGVQNYNQWMLTNNQQVNTETTYITEKFTDLSIDWVNSQDKPWFLWLAYTAPHKPFHAPPVEMHSQGNLPEYVDGIDALPYYLAAVETIDFQIGRLLETMSESDRQNTVIIFIGDNGTPNEVAQLPYLNTTAKGTLYQGGINVPMFISGKGVSRTGNDYNLVTSTDLFSTIAQIAGIATPEINDSKSFKSLLSQSSGIRDFQYTEKDNVTADLWAISNGSYKLIENANGSKEFYDLNNDPYEQIDLLNGTLTTTEIIEKTELETELNIIRN